MAEKMKKVTVCSSCRSVYRIPEVFEGRIVVCKECGTQFKMEMQDENHLELDENDPKVIHDVIGNISQEDPYLLLGKLAMKHNFISEDQIQAALALQERQKRLGKAVFLGEILVNHGMMTQFQLEFLLSIQKMKETRRLDRRFGTIAVKNQFATKEDVDRALKEQKKLFKEKKEVKLLGDILVSFEVMTEDQRDAILERQKRITEIGDVGAESA